MNTGIKGRIRKIKTKVNPTKYKRSDELFIELNLLERAETLTNQEKRRLEELQQRSFHPELIKTLERLESEEI